MLTTNVAEVPKPFARSPRPPNGAARHSGVRFSPRASDPRAFSSRGSIDFRFQGRHDGAHETGYLGRAAAARGVDTGRHAAFGGDTGAGFDENPVLRPPAGANRSAEMFCDERIIAAERVDSARLQVSEVEKGAAGSAAHHRNDCRSVRNRAFHTAAVATSNRSPGHAGCARAACRARKRTDAGSAL